MKKFIFLILIGIIFLIGCNNATSKTKVSDVDVYVGTEGLTAEFSKSVPPPRVFEDSNFPILLRIRNKGAYSIKEKLGGLISIGVEKDYISKLFVEENNQFSGDEENELFFYLDGKTKINPKGDEIVATINAKTGKLDPQSETRTSTITATLCYPYKTTLSTTVCIDPDVSGIRPGKKVCTVKELSFNKGQGAPIAVIKIEPQMIPEADKDIIKPQFLIFIENKGKGTPVNVNGYNNICRESDFSKKNTWNVAFLRAFTSGKETENQVSGKESGEQLVCCPNINGQCPEKETDPNKIAGFMRFKDKKDFVRCTFKDGIPRNSDAFTSPLRIEIDYGYVQTIATTVIIQKPLKY